MSEILFRGGKEMREILFRGKRACGHGWVDGCLINKDGNALIIQSDSDYCHPVIPETVGQYTGLKDRNGVKIFEGDVVRCCGGEFYQGIYEFHENVEVKFETYALSCLHGSDLLEVIGNIHDNPELLEG